MTLVTPDGNRRASHEGVTLTSPGRTAEWLQRTEPFNQLTQKILEAIASHAVIRTLDGGQVVYSEGEVARYIYIVAQGSLKSVRNDAEGREQVLSVERAGTVLAASEIFSAGSYGTTTVAAEASVLLCLETRAAQKLCQEHPRFLWQIALILTNRLRTYRDLAANLSFRTVDQRLAMHLFTIAQDRGVRSDEGCVFELTITRPEIATRLGSVREVVSRSFAHLQERGLIKLRGRLVTISDLEALEHFSSNIDRPRDRARTQRA